MGKRSVGTSIPLYIDRNFPVSEFARAVKALEASTVVDEMYLVDQLTSWIPPVLWTTENSPMANVVPDIDSYPDWYIMAGYGAALAPRLGTSISTDALRRGPAEMMQSMLTLANITEGRATFHVGAGELKQCQPFGRNRAEGMGRLEDFYQIFHAFWESDKPVSFEGKFTELDVAWLGAAKRHRPLIWGLGGGPKILDLATSYADGFITMAMMVWTSPDHLAEQVGQMKQELERKGRDPEKFDFGIYAPVLLHEDADLIERAHDNPILKWTTAIMGRINQADWDKEGIEPPMPRDWHYALKMLPMKVTKTEADAIVGRVTRAMSEKSWICGTPKKVAADLQAYVDAGATFVSVMDMMPLVLSPQDAGMALARSIEVCGLLKNGR